MRRMAWKLGIDRKTVARKLIWLGRQRRAEAQRVLDGVRPGAVKRVQFDDVETSEHSKLKPLSVSVVVEADSQYILGIEVAVKPCSGRNAEKSRRKYGARPDLRPEAWRKLFTRLAPALAPDVEVTMDSNPFYPQAIRNVIPGARLQVVAGRPAVTAGQGEMKQGGFDPLFWVNHGAAMLRANINRLIRRTWCTTKVAERLADHLAIYAHFHNTEILSRRARKPQYSAFGDV